jgi:tetratricopeptide (TPR) repeat protein
MCATVVITAACVRAPKAVPAPPPEAKARPTAPPPTDISYAAGSSALEQNDPVGAARIFAAIPQASVDYALAQKALAATLPDVAVIAQVWLKTVERNIKQERFVAAKKRLEYILDFFMLDDALRSAIENKLQDVDQSAALEHANLEELDKQVLPLMQSGDLDSALKVMRRGLNVARDAAPDSLLERERRIAAVQEHTGARVEAAIAAAPPPKEPPKQTRDKRRRKNDKSDVPVAQVTPVAIATPSALPSDDMAEPESVQPRVPELTEQAQAFQENKSYFNAIVTWSRVRQLDPSNDQASRALTQLEPKRQALVLEYLETANKYFQQQDLESAVPYFRRVLALDAGNEQAKKGLEMHYNLERIRREKNRR